jgi:hypothetical protein
MTSLQILFLAAFIGGLLLAVFAMLHGVEYTRRNRERAPSPFFNIPSIAAFAVAFGAVGYPLVSRTRMSSLAIVLLATATAVVATTGMVILLARWALAGGHGVTPDAEDIQGLFAVVSRDITPQVHGEISYEYSGRRVRAPARTIGNISLPAGSEVVIDRIEDGVAFVESWAAVEGRL